MGNKESISAFQAYLIMALSIGVTNHVLLIPVLLSVAMRDSWVGVIAAILPSLGYAIVLTHVLRRRTLDSQANRKRAWRCAIRRATEGAGVLFAFMVVLVTLKDTVNWTHASYLPQTPKLSIAILLLFLSGCAAWAGIGTIAICSGLLLPLVISLGLFVMTANLQYKDYTLLFPLFTQGYLPAVKASMNEWAGIFELSFLLLLGGQLSSEVRWKGIAILTITLTGLTLGPLVGCIAIFGPFEGAELRYPPFEQWRMVALGKFISHLDFLSIFQWLSGSFIRISLMLYLIVNLTLRNVESRRLPALLLVSMLVVAGAALLPINDMLFYTFLKAFYFPLTMGFGLIILTGAWLSGERRPTLPTDGGDSRA